MFVRKSARCAHKFIVSRRNYGNGKLRLVLIIKPDTLKSYNTPIRMHLFPVATHSSAGS